MEGLETWLHVHMRVCVLESNSFTLSVSPSVILSVLVCVAMISWYIHKRDQEMRALYIMVDRITGGGEIKCK